MNFCQHAQKPIKNLRKTGWKDTVLSEGCLTVSRSSHQRCSVKKGILRNLAKFTGKHLCQSLFFNKVAGGAYNFIKKETLTQVFSCKFCEIFEKTFFTEHVWATDFACQIPVMELYAN